MASGCTPAGGPWNGGIFAVGRGPAPGALKAADGPGRRPGPGALAGAAITARAARTDDRRKADLRLIWIVCSLAHAVRRFF